MLNELNADIVLAQKQGNFLKLHLQTVFTHSLIKVVFNSSLLLFSVTLLMICNTVQQKSVKKCQRIVKQAIIMRAANMKGPNNNLIDQIKNSNICSYFIHF